MNAQMNTADAGLSMRAVLIAFAIALVVLAQGISAPFVKDAEPQAAGWIQDVASGKHLLVPRDWYGEMARKPPLFYWAAGAIATMSGGRVDEVRARLVSVIAGVAVAVMTLMWTAAFVGSATGWLAFLFLLGSYGFSARGTMALEDMLLVAFMFAGWCLLYPAIERRASRGAILRDWRRTRPRHPDQGTDRDRAAGVRRGGLSPDDAPIDNRATSTALAVDGACDIAGGRVAVVPRSDHQ